MRSIVLLFTALPLCAWNETGHKVVAEIAWRNLKPVVRQKVEALLKEHPHSGKWGAHPLWEAAYWPDAIRGTEWDHPTWHYINLPFSPDGTPFPPVNWDAPSVLTQIEAFRKTVSGAGTPAPERAVQLAWLLHLTGDVHQPLHAVARFTRTLPQGDRGGNSVYVAGARNLHAYWDSLLGDTPSEAFILKAADSLIRTEQKGPPNQNPRDWVEEGFRIAQESAYTFGNENGSRRNPMALSDAYRVEAHRIGRARGALAGYRLAELLNRAFEGP